jgi:hypothetical protein
MAWRTSIYILIMLNNTSNEERKTDYLLLVCYNQAEEAQPLIISCGRYSGRMDASSSYIDTELRQILKAECRHICHCLVGR